MNEENNNKDFSDKVIDSVDKIVNTTNFHKEYSNEEKKNYRKEAIVSYIPFVSILFIIKSDYKKSEYLKFHVNQGLLVTLVFVASIILSAILHSLFTRDSFIINDIPGWVSFIIYLAYCLSFILMMFGIICTANDESKELPLIGKLRLLK